MAIAGGIDVDFVKFRKEFVLELIDLRKQYQEEYLRWAAEKLAAARKEFGSQSTEELEGYQVLPFSKTPRVGRPTKSRLCVDTPDENEEAEKATVEPYKENEGTKRVTRTASRRALAEMNTIQPPLTAAEPQPAPTKRPTRGRRKKVAEEPVTLPSKRTTRAASKRAAAAAAAMEVIVLEDDEEEGEVLAPQHDGGQQMNPLESAVESGATVIEEDVSSQPCSQSELHVVDDADETDGDTAEEAGVRKHAKRAKVSIKQNARSKQRTSNQNRKGSKQMRASPLSCPVSQPPPTSPPKVTFSIPPLNSIEEDNPLPKDVDVDSPVPKDSEEDSPFLKGVEEDSPVSKDVEEGSPLLKDIKKRVEQPTMEEESPPPAEVPSGKAPVEDMEDAKGLAGDEDPGVCERVEEAASPVVVGESVPSSKTSSPDLLTPYMKNSPFQLAACRGSNGSGAPEEHCRRGTFLVSAAGEAGAGQQVEGNVEDKPTEVTQVDQCSNRDEQAQKSAQRKTVVRSFFLPLERSKLGEGNVARMVRDIETSSTPSALHKKATIEPESLSSSSKLPMHQGNSLKVPTSDSDDENSKIHRFFAFVMEKATGKKDGGMSALNTQTQPVEAVAPIQQTPEESTTTRADLSSFFDSLLRKPKPGLGDASGSAKESKDESKEQETSPSLQETYPDLKKSKSRGSIEEYLTADEQDVSIDASPSAVVGEEQHSEGTPNTQGSNSEGSSDATSPEETSEKSPPGVGPAGLPSTSLPQSTSSYAATASWRPEYWEAWHARSKDGKSGQLKPAPLHPDSRLVTFLQSSSEVVPSHSSSTAVASVSSPKKVDGLPKKQGITCGPTAKQSSRKFLSLLKLAPPQKELQSAAPSAPPAMSFLPCLTSPAKHPSQSEKKHELQQRIEEKDRKVKEFELQKHKEHKDKFKKQKERALLVSQRRAQLEEEEEAKRLQQLAKKEDLLSKKRNNLLSKKQKELEDLRRKQEEQLQAVQLRKKQQEVEFQKKLQAQLEEEEKVAAENEKRRLEYEEREKQRRKVEDDRKRKVGENFSEDPNKKQGCERDDSDTACGRKVAVPISKPQHPLGNTFTKPPPYQPGTSGSGGSKLLRPGFASPAKTAQTAVAVAAHSFISPQMSSYSLPKRHPVATSYAMTPDVFNQVESYDIQDLSSSDDTEDEETTTKPIPLWAQPQALKQALREQESKSWDIESIFPAPQLPIDLVSIFGRRRKRYHYRTSSVNWDTPPKAKKRYCYV